MWLSGYLVLPSYDTVVHDQVIMDVVKPFTQAGLAAGTFTNYFFARSWHLWPHVRVRVVVQAGSQRAAEALFEEYVARRLSAPPLGGQVDGLPRGARPSSHASLFWFPYVRETGQYGGSQAMELAERFFRDSTDVAFRLLEGIGSGRLDRDGIGLAAMVVCLGSIIRDVGCAATTARLVRDWNAPRDLDAMFERRLSCQADALAVQIAEVWAATMAGGLPSPLDAYAGAAQNAKERLEHLLRLRQLIGPGGTPVMSFDEAATMLVPIYMHMISNQLGLSDLSEAFAGYAVWKALRTTRVRLPARES